MKININNISSTNKRLRLTPRNGATASLNSVIDNPTLSIINNKVSVCLKASTQISCYGATEYANIWFNGQSAAYIQATVEMTNVYGTQIFGGVDQYLKDFTLNIQEQTGVDFYIGCGGEVNIHNYSDIEYRVTIIFSDTSIIVGGNDNPTMQINQSEGTFKFCLGGMAT